MQPQHVLAPPKVQPWRDDGRCGPSLDAPDGTQPARCNPWDAMKRTCCSATGECIHDDSCINGTEYRIRRVWRADGRCGVDVRDSDGRMSAKCHPLHPKNLTCCSEEGWCGAWPSYAHCRCKDCVNHHAACMCTTTHAPCQDPASGRCYPRTQSGDIPDEPEPQARVRDRRPEQDPRKAMRDALVEERFAGIAGRLPAKSVGAPVVSQRPVVDGMRCAVDLVDCTAHNQLATVPSRSVPVVDAGERGASNATVASTAPSLTAPNRSAGAVAEEPPPPPPPTVPLPSAPPPPLPIRLAGGQRPREGRVELLFNGTWGSVCGKGWGWTAAHVACRSLGFGGVESLSDSAEYGRGLGPVLLSHVDCEGTEKGLEHCRYFGLGESTVPRACLQHLFDAGVQCSRQALPTPKRVPLVEHEPTHLLNPAVKISVAQDGTASQRDCSDAAHTAAPHDLPSALDALEGVLADLEQRRRVVEEPQLARLSRLRLRLRRLAGKSDEPEPTRPCDCAQRDKNQSRAESQAPSSTEAEEAARAALADALADDSDDVEAASAGESDIPLGLAARLPADMLNELRRMPRQEDRRPLQEARAEFEERVRQENFDPLANDPVEQELRRRREQYDAPHSRPPPLAERKPHERLRKPPIQALTNRKPPDWKTAYEARYEYTMEQIRLGLAPEGIMRTLGPGPWDNEPGFGPDPNERNVVLDHELDEDIVFDDY